MMNLEVSNQSDVIRNQRFFIARLWHDRNTGPTSSSVYSRLHLLCRRHAGCSKGGVLLIRTNSTKLEESFYSRHVIEMTKEKSNNWKTLPPPSQQHQQQHEPLQYKHRKQQKRKENNEEIYAGQNREHSYEKGIDGIRWHSRGRCCLFEYPSISHVTRRPPPLPPAKTGSNSRTRKRRAGNWQYQSLVIGNSTTVIWWISFTFMSGQDVQLCTSCMKNLQLENF